MFRISELKVPFVWFYLFGLSSFIPFKRSRDKVFLIISIIPKVLYAIVIVIFTINYLNLNRWKTFKTQTGTVYLFTIAKILPDILTIWLQLRRPYAMQTISEMFVNCFQLLHHQLKIKADSKNFSKKFHKKIILNLFIQLTLGVIKAIMRPPSYTLYKLIFLTCSNLYHIFIVLNITLFIDLMQYFLFTINANMNYVVRNRRADRNRLIKIVDSIKLLHLSLWKISNLINSYFGVILVVILIHNFTFLTFEIYCTILYMETIEQIRKLTFIRNYIFSKLFVCSKHIKPLPIDLY